MQAPTISIAACAAIACCVLSTSGFAGPDADPADLCTAAIQRAAGTHARCLLHADADLSVSDDLDAYLDRVDRCEDVFERRHQRALARFGADNCPEGSADDLADNVFQSTASVTLAAANTAGGAAIARLGPMTEAVRGMNYQPAPSNYTLPPPGIYFDTDFYNQDFIQLWGTGASPNQPGGRDDVGDMLSLGVNFIRVFNWNPTGRDHEPWLQDLASKRIYTAGVLSNFFIDNPGEAHLVVDQLNASKAKAQIAVWLVGNEISPTDSGTRQVLEAIKTASSPLDTIPICIPFQMSSLQDAIDKVRINYQQQFLPAGLQHRFIACLNFYGLGRAATSQSPEDQLEEFVTGFFADPFIEGNDIELLLTEFGINFDGSSGVEPNAGGDAPLQGQYLSAMLAHSIALQARYPRFLGQVVFEYTNEGWKAPPLTEANFGLYSLTEQTSPTERTTSGDPYPVDQLVARPQHDAVAKNY